MAEKITLKPIEVGKEDTEVGVDFSKLDDNQLAIAEKIVKEAEAQGVDPDLALSLAHIESGFNPAAKSKKGALGVMQLMPGTAKDLGVDPTDPDQNIKGGIAYYKQQLDKYKDPYVAGIAYNAGPGVADKFLETDDVSVIPTETLGYVEKLGSLYKPAELTVAEKEMPTVEEAPVEMSTEEMIKSIVTSMSIEVAKQIETIRTELSAQIAEVKTNQVEVKASTKAKPEVAETSNKNVKLTRNQKILNNLKNLN